VVGGLAASVVAGTLATMPTAPMSAATSSPVTAPAVPALHIQGIRVLHARNAHNRGTVPAITKHSTKPGEAVPFDVPVGRSFTTPSQAGWTAQELQSAYQIPAANGGSGKLFATVVAYDATNAESDLAQYRSAFNLPPCTTANGCFTKLAQDGSTTYPPATSIDWAAEATLDIDMASATCPNCRIALIEANSASTSDLLVAVAEANKLGAAVVNMSWGAPEFSGENTQDSTFSGSGVRYFASSGDCGACATNWPAASPAVLSVGGTNLQQVTSAPNPSGDLWSENAWSGSVTGCSPYETAPSWQSGTTCASGKAIPDVSADAGTAIAIFYNPPPGATAPVAQPAVQPFWVNGWQGAGGTSASSPLTAALWALLGDPTALADGPGLDYYDTAFLAGGGSVNWLDYCGSVPCWALQTGLGSLRGPVPRPGGADNTERYNNNTGEAGPSPCHHGDPVMCATGNLAESSTDLTIPGRGQNLQFARTYNAQAAVSQTSPAPLGDGWTDSYNAYLSINTTNGNVTVVQSDGTTVAFAPTSGGNYSAAGWVTATLVKNANGTYTYTLHDLRSSTFNASGQLISESDRNGYVTTLAYNASGQLATVTDQAGRSLTFAYNTAGEIASVTDPGGRVVSFAYDGSGNLTSATDAAGKTTHYSYDASHRMTSMTNPNGGVTTNVYDTSNRVTSQTDPAGRTTTFAYANTANNTHTTTITDPLGIQAVQQYDQYDNLIKLTKASNSSPSATWTYAYIPGTGEMTNATDPNGHTTTYTWDAAGDQLSVIDPLQQATTYTYDSAGDQLTKTDAAGVTTTKTYTAHHDLATSATPVGNGTTATTTYAYSATNPGDVISMTDPNGHTTTYAYDAAGDQTSQTDPAGDTTTWAYNVVGERTSTVSPRGNAVGGNPAAFTSTSTYDGDGRTTSVTDALGHRTAYAYDAAGNRTAVTDATGATTTSTYDADNEVTKVTNPDGTSYVYTYDAGGRKTAYTDGSGHVWSYGYDAQGRLTSTSDPLHRTTTYAYDAAGNRTGLTDPSGQTTTSTYDVANELTAVSYSSGTAPTVNYAYDADGRRTRMVDGTGTTTDVYDGLGRVTSTTSGAGDTVGYTYDLAGNPVVQTYAGLTVTHVFDAADRMTSVSDGLGDVTTFGYDADGNLTTEAYPNGVVATYAYDAADRPSSIADTEAAATVASFTYARTADELVSNATETTPTAAVSSTTLGPTTTTSSTYGYSTLQRITSANGGTYSYDATGNLTAGAGATLGYDAAGEVTSLTQPAATGGTATTTFGYDSRGDRTSVTTGGPTSSTTTLTYDQAGRLTSYGSGASYVYNGDGLRMAKHVGTSTAGLVTSDFVWDTVTTNVPLVLFDTVNTYVYGPGGRPVEQLNAAAPLYLHQDQLGSTRLLTDPTGHVVATASYDVYGNPTSRSGSVVTPLGFAGQYTDLESGLIYLRARYYDPATSQFLTVDPKFSTTLAAYSYAGDDPVNAFDPLGLDWWNPFSWSKDTWKTIGKVAAGVGIVAGAAALCAATACIGDIAAAAGATTLAETLGAAETTSTIAGWVGLGSAAVGTTADAFQTYDSCHTGFSSQCAWDAGGLIIDLATFGVDKFIPEDVIAKPIYALGSGIAGFLYGEISDLYGGC
jgi:RHS repeat-associated protein